MKIIFWCHIFFFGIAGLQVWSACSTMRMAEVNIGEYKAFTVESKSETRKEKVIVIRMENDSIFKIIQIIVNDSTFNQYQIGDTIK